MEILSKQEDVHKLDKEDLRMEPLMGSSSPASEIALGLGRPS
jgi:hypothetical protein